MEHIIKASAIIAILYLFYKLLLQRETFFKSNRWFLLIGLLVALTVPLIVIPVYVEYTPVNVTNYAFIDVTPAATDSGLSLIDYTIFAYVLGMVLFFTRFLIQMSSLARVIAGNDKEKIGEYTFVKTAEDVSPFSFFNWIVYNPDQFDQAELNQIIAHEKVHAKQYHSIDILLTHLACIALWFNPFIWLYAKDLKQNLEFLADNDTVNNTVCKKTYQYTLLKTSVPTHQLALSNNFYNSLIKKRIVMLQKSKSKNIKKIKYALVVPLIALFLMSFNTKEIYIEKTEPVVNMMPNTILGNLEPFETSTALGNEMVIVKPSAISNGIDARKELEVFIITKTTTDAELDKIAKTAKSKGVTLKFKGLSRNAEGEITAIKIEASGKDSNANFNLNSDEAIAPIKIAFGKNGKNISIGNADIKREIISYVIKDGDTVSHKIRRTGSGTNAIFISDEDEVYELNNDSIHFITKDKGENTFKKRIKVVEINENSDEDDIIEVMVDNDDINKEEDIIIVKGNESNGKSYKIKTLGKGEGKNKFVLKTEDGEEPLYIIDGKVVDSKTFKALDNDDIKTINVIKGDSAIKKHGKPAEHGVVEITTKK